MVFQMEQYRPQCRPAAIPNSSGTEPRLAYACASPSCFLFLKPPRKFVYLRRHQTANVSPVPDTAADRVKFLVLPRPLRDSPFFPAPSCQTANGSAVPGPRDLLPFAMPEGTVWLRCARRILHVENSPAPLTPRRPTARSRKLHSDLRRRHAVHDDPRRQIQRIRCERQVVPAGTQTPQIENGNQPAHAH
jgi:hypothetical protein